MSFLFGMKSDSPDKLLDKFNKSSKSSAKLEILDKLLALKAYDQLEQLIDTDFQSKIVPDLMNVYRDNAEKLFAFYHKCSLPKLKDKLVEYILDTGNETIIWSLCQTEHKFKIISFIMTEYKDDPEVLCGVFKQEIQELQEAVVKRLIELKAQKELNQLIDTDFGEVILDNLILLNRDNSAKLIELLQKVKSKSQKNTIIKFLVENGSDEELWKLADGEFSEHIIKFFFTKARESAADLLELYNDSRFANKKLIVDRLYEMEANEQLFKLPKGEFFEAVNDYLIPLNRNNPDILLQVFNRTEQGELKNTILHLLIELSAEPQLWTLLDGEFSHVVTHCLINLNQENAEKLFTLFAQTKLNEQKELIIRQLIQLKAEEQLWKLLTSEYKDMILPILVEINHDNSKKLYSLFFKSHNHDLKLEIVNNLMDLESEQMLWMLMNTEFSDLILSFLYDNYINDAEKLYSIYDKSTGELKRKIINRLIALKAEVYLWKLVETPAKSKVLPTLIDLDSSSPDKLWQLYELAEDHSEKKSIVIYLMDLEAKEQLFKLSDTEFKDMVLPVLLKILPYKEVFSRYNPLDISLSIMHNQDNDCANFLETYAELLKLAFSNKLLAIYYFCRLKEREQTYLLLINYGLGEFIDLPTIQISFEAIKDFFPKAVDCVELGLTEYAGLFKRVFAKAFKHQDRNLLILAYLLNKEKFAQTVQLIKENYNIIDDAEELQTYRNQIKLKFAELLQQAPDKDEVEKLVKRRDKELEKYLERALFDTLNEIVNTKVIIPQISMPKFFSPDKSDTQNSSVDLTVLPNDVKIITNFEETKKNFEKELELRLLTLDETEEIIQAKSETDYQLSKIVDQNSFCYALEAEGSIYADNKEIKAKLMQYLVNHTSFPVRKAIIDFMNMHDRRLWLKSLLIVVKSRDITCLTYCFMKYQLPYSARSLHMLFKYFTDKFTVDLKLIKKISGLPEKDINDHKIDKFNNEMIIWDVLFIYLVLVLENIHYLYFNGCPGDLKALKLADRHIAKLPPNLQPQIANILHDVIKKIEEGRN